jgi:hypothetical protein
MTNTNIARIDPAKRLLYTLIGLVAGDLMLLFVLVRHSIHATLLAGEPAPTIADAVQTFALYAAFSFVGWLFVGLPVALLLPATSFARLSWPLAVVVGAALGPPALLVIFVLLGRNHIYFRNLGEIGTLFAYTILVSTVSCMVYLALLRKEITATKAGRSQRYFHKV